MSWTHTGLSSQGVDEGTSIKFSDSPSVDAYFRARGSSPFLIFNHKQIWNDPDLPNNAENSPLIFDNQETSGSGTTTTFNVNRASTTLAVSAATAGTRVRQTRQRFNHIGKSQIAYFSCAEAATSNGVIKRIGLFDQNNGIFIESDGGDLFLVVRSNVTGTPVNTHLAQSEWNDNLEGTGASGQNLEAENIQLFFFDFQWPAGRIRWGIFMGGAPIYFDDVSNENIGQTAYMSTPNLPFRTEISNDGSGTADSFECMSVAIIVEGGRETGGFSRANDTGDTAIDAMAKGTDYAVVGMRLKQNYLSAEVTTRGLSIIEMSAGNNPFLWRVHLNPTLSVPVVFVDEINSAIQFGVAGSGDVISDPGIVVGSGYASSNTQQVNVDIQNALRLGSLIDGTADRLIVSATPITNNQSYLASINWHESW